MAEMYVTVPTVDGGLYFNERKKAYIDDAQFYRIHWRDCINCGAPANIRDFVLTYVGYFT